MAHQVCSRCQRANPGDAVFCYFDGVPLGHAGAAAGALPREFVFPSGRRCRTFDELAQGCYAEWDAARDVLHRGDFARFLGHAGRLDLVRAAQEAQAESDADIALYNFVRALPAGLTQGPRLELNPRRLMLGVLRPGEQREVKLTLSNQGQGVLQGKVSVGEGGDWLKVVGGEDDSRCEVKTAGAQQVLLRVQTQGLVPRTYSAKLTIITNGGIAEVPVRLDLTAIPFAVGPFRGAGSPREMAQKMRAHPKQAAPLLNNGEIARWFAVNGWTYPVSGTPAPGVAAVQQFFEGMGLSKPPALQLTESEFNFVCVPPDVREGQFTLRTSAKKWVYAQADSDKPWLRVTTPAVSGPQQARIGFEVDSGLMRDEQRHEGVVQVVANAGQKLSVRVVVEVRRPREPVASRLLRPLIVLALLALLLRVLLVPPADLYARILAAEPGPPARGTLERWGQSATAEETFLKHFVLATWWVGGVVGLVVVWRRGGRWADYFCGLLAGSGAGLAGSATLGCLLTAGDFVPRMLLRLGTHRVHVHPSPWVGTPLWVVLACLCWALLGAGLGAVLALLGARGRRVMEALAFPFAWLLRLCGLNRAAALLGA